MSEDDIFGSEFDNDYEDEDVSAEESSNRTFMIAAGVLGGIVLLSIACLAVFALVILPQQNRAKAEATQSAANALATQNAQVDSALTATGVAYDLSQTPQASPTLPATNTPVLAQSEATSTPEFTNTPDSVTQTVAAGQATVAVSTMTVFPTSTQLPASGFADEVGLPGMMIAAMVLVAVIFLVRRLRAVPTK
jgi:hypothetical protein